MVLMQKDDTIKKAPQIIDNLAPKIEAFSKVALEASKRPLSDLLKVFYLFYLFCFFPYLYLFSFLFFFLSLSLSLPLSLHSFIYPSLCSFTEKSY